MVVAKQVEKTYKSPSRQSRFGLNAANFFQAEAVGVVLPVLNTFLREAHWRYDQIGVATALLGLGTLLFQTPAGILVDRVKNRRLLFFVASIAVGICFGVIPFVPHTAIWVDSLLFLSGVAQSLFIPSAGRTCARPRRLPGPESDAGRKPGLEPRRQYRCRIIGLLRCRILWQRLYFLLRSDCIAGGRLFGLLDPIAGTG